TFHNSSGLGSDKAFISVGVILLFAFSTTSTILLLSSRSFKLGNTTFKFFILSQVTFIFNRFLFFISSIIALLQANILSFNYECMINNLIEKIAIMTSNNKPLFLIIQICSNLLTCMCI